MVVVPPPTPRTTPAPETVATDVIVLLQTPPGVGSESVIVLPTQTVDGPVIVPAVGATATVTVADAVQVPIV